MEQAKENRRSARVPARTARRNFQDVQIGSEHSVTASFLTALKALWMPIEGSYVELSYKLGILWEFDGNVGGFPEYQKAVRDHKRKGSMIAIVPSKYAYGLMQLDFRHATWCLAPIIWTRPLRTRRWICPWKRQWHGKHSYRSPQ